MEAGFLARIGWLLALVLLVASLGLGANGCGGPCSEAGAKATRECEKETREHEESACGPGGRIHGFLNCQSEGEAEAEERKEFREGYEEAEKEAEFWGAR